MSSVTWSTIGPSTPTPVTSLLNPLWSSPGNQFVITTPFSSNVFPKVTLHRAMLHYRYSHSQCLPWMKYFTLCKLYQSVLSPTCISSKHDGLAGTRFGWGLYQDPKLASGVAHTVASLMLGLSVDVQLRVLSSLQVVLSKWTSHRHCLSEHFLKCREYEHNLSTEFQPWFACLFPGDNPSPSGLLPFHSATREVLYSRFQQLASVLTCAQLTNTLSSPGAYAWVRCAEGVQCMEFFIKVNLTVESGEAFGSTPQCKKLQLTKLLLWPMACKCSRHTMLNDIENWGEHEQVDLLDEMYKWCTFVCTVHMP